MYYMEFLYVRNRLLWFMGIITAIALVFLYFVAFPPPGAHIRNEGQDVLMDPMLILASVPALVMASMLAGTLNRDQSHLAYVWTRPIPRARIALTYVLIDAAAILLSYGFVVAVVMAVLAVPPQNHVIPDADTGAILARSILVPLMIYAIVEIATSWIPQRFQSAIGIFWGAAWATLILAELNLPFPLGQLLRLLNLLNPIAYFPSYQGHGVNVQMGPEELPHIPTIAFDLQTLLGYAICLVALIVATYNWKRMEA